MSPSEDPKTDGLELLPGWSSLVMLLTLFALLAVVTLLAMLRKDETRVDSHTGGLVAYGPADFPEVAFDEPLPQAVVEAAKGDNSGIFNVPPPPFSDEMLFPCSDCHGDMDVNYERREMEFFHDEIELSHGPADRWCFDCHNAEDRDTLRLTNGDPVRFEESYRLCGQCHGTIYRDWRAGIHGRRRGFWNGAKSYLLCAHCHNPHAPAFKAMTPMSPPVRPGLLAEQREEPATEEMEE